MPLERQQKRNDSKMKCMAHTRWNVWSIQQHLAKMLGNMEKKILHKPTGRKPRGKKDSYEKYAKPDIRRNIEKVMGILEIVFFGFKFEKDKIKMKAESI